MIKNINDKKLIKIAISNAFRNREEFFDQNFKLQKRSIFHLIDNTNYDFGEVELDSIDDVAIEFVNSSTQEKFAISVVVPCVYIDQDAMPCRTIEESIKSWGWE